MAEEYDDLYCEQLLIGPIDPTSSMVVIRESTIFAKDDRIVFPPINHENLQVPSSSVHGFDSYVDSQSESSSPSSSSRLSASSSSFSLSPSDSGGQSPVTACEFEPKSPSPPSETENITPPSDSDEQPPLTICEFDQKPPPSPSDLIGESPPSDSDWWELLLVRVNSKLKTLVTWFSTNLRSIYPVLAVAIWWWMRVRARRKRVGGETIRRLRDTIKEKDERIVKLLHQIAQTNELLIKHHKEIVSRR